MNWVPEVRAHIASLLPGENNKQLARGSLKVRGESRVWCASDCKTVKLANVAMLL